MKPELAEAQPPDGPGPYQQPPGGGHAGVGDGPGPFQPPAPPPSRVDPTRYFGSIELDGARPSPRFSQLATEVIAHLAALDGADVTISVEIKARREIGFPSDTVRIVNENAAQLKFDPGSGFENE